MKVQKSSQHVRPSARPEVSHFILLFATRQVGTPVTAESFAKWSIAKIARKQLEAEARVKAEQAKKKGGKGLCKCRCLTVRYTQVYSLCRVCLCGVDALQSLMYGTFFMKDTNPTTHTQPHTPNHTHITHIDTLCLIHANTAPSSSIISNMSDRDKDHLHSQSVSQSVSQ